MIKAIDKKYCKNNLVQYMIHAEPNQLIVSSDEIILLKIGDKILINKYENHPSRNLFPYSDKIKTDDYDNYYNELFEYNKTYLNLIGSSNRFGFQELCFYKGNDRALCQIEPLGIDERPLEEKSIIASRKQLEAIFDKNIYNSINKNEEYDYDSMYLIHTSGAILFASSRTNGLVIDKNIIPSDQEIIEKELADRIWTRKIAKNFSDNQEDSEEKEKWAKTQKPKTIEEIKNFEIYHTLGITTMYSYLLLTSKNGKFDLRWIDLEFVEKDKFKITYRKIPVIEPNVDDLLDSYEKYGIEPAYNPEYKSNLIRYINKPSYELEEKNDTQPLIKEENIVIEDKNVKKLSKIFRRKHK